MAIVIVLFAQDRAFRAAADRALRAAGATVRVASRQAELAKALSGSASRVVVVGPLHHDHAIMQAVCAAMPAADAASITLIHTTPGDTIDDVVRRAFPGDQPPGV